MQLTVINCQACLISNTKNPPKMQPVSLQVCSAEAFTLREEIKTACFHTLSGHVTKQTNTCWAASIQKASMTLTFQMCKHGCPTISATALKYPFSAILARIPIALFPKTEKLLSGQSTKRINLISTLRSEE